MDKIIQFFYIDCLRDNQTILEAYKEHKQYYGILTHNGVIYLQFIEKYIVDESLING